SQFLVDLKTPGISTRPIHFAHGPHEFNEVLFEDVLLPEDYLMGEQDMAWKQATSELAYERSGSERFLETIEVLFELIDLIGENPDTREAEGLGRLVAQLHTLRRMSISVAGMLAAGKEPVLEASVVKDLGTNWEQALPSIARDLAAFVDRDPGNRMRFEEVLAHNIRIAPKLTIQGGTREVLRGIIARGLGLR
ncbi:MAG: acyl-CoA dehydrogenase family protein, partial [Alphaproteobacteria bacterium]|nr:acyl-CoA dehydrogenase family protein [Alphaproteobacteria bacterium]